MSRTRRQLAATPAPATAVPDDQAGSSTDDVQLSSSTSNVEQGLPVWLIPVGILMLTAVAALVGSLLGRDSPADKGP